jgi:hypothetical protein
MRVLALLASTVVGSTALAAQASPRWQYGRLCVVHGIPFVWSAGDSAAPIDSALEVKDRQTKTLPMTLLMRTFDRLGNEGWELILMIPEPNSNDVSYVFKRRRK